MNYGFAVVDKDGEPAPLNRRAYDSKSAASVGFSHWSARVWKDGPYGHLRGKKFNEQTEFEIVPLVLGR